MRSKYRKLPLFPPSIRVKQYRAKINKFHATIEKCYALLSVFPSNHFAYILKLKEAYDSLYSQGMKLSLEKVCELKCRDGENSIFIKRIDNYLKAIAYIEHVDDSEYGTTRFYEKLHTLAEKDFFKVEDEIGKIRVKQNWIGTKNCTAEEAFFFPPPPEKIHRLMTELEIYLKKETEPLIQLGIGIAQFLLIHPFMDGNGRVARLFAGAHIKKKGLLKEPLLFLSSYFLKHRTSYLKHLFVLTFERRWKPWLDFYFEGLMQESFALYRNLKKLTNLYLEIRLLFHEELDAMQREHLMRYLFQHPVFLKRDMKLHMKLPYFLVDKILKRLQVKRYIRRNKRGFYVFSSLLGLEEKK